MVQGVLNVVVERENVLAVVMRETAAADALCLAPGARYDLVSDPKHAA